MAIKDLEGQAGKAARGLDGLSAAIDRVGESSTRAVAGTQGGDVQPASSLERINPNDGATVGGAQGQRSADGSRGGSLEKAEKRILSALDRAQQAEAQRRIAEKRNQQNLAVELRGLRQALAAKFNRELEDRSSTIL